MGRSASDAGSIGEVCDPYCFADLMRTDKADGLG
jgi:hypothetical protein